MQRKNFELIIPYIEALKKANAGLVIGFSGDLDKCMSNIHVFPGFMNPFPTCVPLVCTKELFMLPQCCPVPTMYTQLGL